MQAILEVRELVRAYAADGVAVRAVQDLSLEVAAGEFVALLGASGSGKSTLLHLIAGLDRPDGGTIRIEGRDLLAMSDAERTIFRRRRLGIIFQAYNLLPTLTAVENVALPALLDGAAGRDVHGRARELLQLVDLAHRLSHRPQAMSGGEQQRVAIARAMMNDPALILADEPTGNLDTHHGQEIWTLLRRLAQEEGRTIIAVTHDLDCAAYANRVVVIKDGRIAGTFTPGEQHDATLVAARYAELAK